METPRDRAEAFERETKRQFRNLRYAAREAGCLLTRLDLPIDDFGKGGMEHEVYHDFEAGRFWKSTFPGQAGFGPAGFTTPEGYLRRLRLSNIVFGDDVRFEGILERRDGPSIVTSQRVVLHDTDQFIPTKQEVEEFMEQLGFLWQKEYAGWERDEDGILVRDCHPRNYIKTPDGEIVAIDVQPIQASNREWENVIPLEQVFGR